MHHYKPYFHKFFNDMRKCSLDRMIYPKDVILLDKLMPEKEMKKQSIEEGIPEFLRFRIIESDVRNVV